MKSIGIFAAPYKPQAIELAGHLLRMAETEGIAVRLQESAARPLQRPTSSAPMSNSPPPM
jgi:hypothetical protein